MVQGMAGALTAPGKAELCALAGVGGQAGGRCQNPAMVRRASILPRTYVTHYTSGLMGS